MEQRKPRKPRNKLPPISPNQKDIIEKLKINNIAIDAVAGCGKTTTNMYIAMNFSGSNILLLTYNSKLKTETRRKIVSCKLKNIECHSYHSFCVKYFFRTCFTDSGIHHVIDANLKPISPFSYDIIIIDEAQDMTNLYYELVCKINAQNPKRATICMLGDKYQSIYEFNGSDERYLRYASRLFGFNSSPWVEYNMKKSFRITNTMADFLNMCMLKYNRIEANKKSKYKPRYLKCSTFPKNNEYGVYDELLYYMNDMKYKPSDIFILSPSMKSQNCPARILENWIKTNLPDVPIYIPNSDDKKIDETVTKRKLVFSTFHQSKGLERKVVIILCFDSGYFEYYNKDAKQDVCCNELYMACTRGLERLTVIHSHDKHPLPFICVDKLDEYSEIIGECRKKRGIDEYTARDMSVTDFVRHMPSDVEDHCMKYLDIIQIKPIGQDLNISHKVRGKKWGTMEDVSNINGIAIPAYCEYIFTQNISIMDYCTCPYPKINEKIYYDRKIHKFWKDNLEKIKALTANGQIPKNILRIAAFYNSVRTRCMCVYDQISKYDWIDDSTFLLCEKRFRTLNISTKANYEVSICARQCDACPQLSGQMDCVDGNTVYEFKCTTKLEKSHYLQLAVYMYICMRSGALDNRYMLYNIITDEMVEVKCNFEKLREMVEYMACHKYANIKKTSDEIFIQRVMCIFNKYA